MYFITKYTTVLHILIRIHLHLADGHRWIYGGGDFRAEALQNV